MLDPFRGAAARLFAFLSLALPGLVAQSPTPVPAPPQLLLAFDAVAGTVQDLTVAADPARDFVVEVALGAVVRQLLLRQHEVRAAGFQLLVRDAAGEHVVPTPPCVTYRGSLLDDPTAIVAATIEGASITAIVRLADEGWVIQPVREVAPSAGPRAHIVYRTQDSANLPWTCGVQASATAPAPEVVDGDIVYECQLAVEADFPFYQLNGSNATNTQNDVTSVVNAMNTIYTNDVQIRYVVTQIIVDTSADPYTSSVASTLLNQFASYWNANRGGVARDVAHLFTGRGMGQASGGAVGIATLGTICNLGSAYGISQSRFSTNFARRVAVTAHELGHNWNAQHCDAVPPCYIMCSGIGGCANVQTSFSQNERNQIIAFRQTRGCLIAVPTTPVIASASPTLLQNFRPPEVSLNGTGFTGTTQVQLGAVTLGAGQFQVVSDTLLRFTPPSGMPLGLANLTATNAAGVSNSSALFFVQTNPCELYVPPVVLGGTNANFTFGGLANDPWYLVVSLGNTTSPLSGWPVLNSLSVLSIGGFDANGLGSFSIFVPPAVLNGLSFYTQVLDLSQTAIALNSSSNVAPITIFF